MCAINQSRALPAKTVYSSVQMKRRTVIIVTAIVAMGITILLNVQTQDGSQILSHLSGVLSRKEEPTKLILSDSPNQPDEHESENDAVYSQFKVIKVSKTMMAQVESELTSMEPGRLVNLKLFAESLAPHMELAFKDVGRAKEIFDDLKICAMGESLTLPIMVRALCAANAQRISNNFPAKFSSEMAELKQALPSQMKNVLEVMSKN
jgi:hypothetical protein